VAVDLYWHGRLPGRSAALGFVAASGIFRLFFRIVSLRGDARVLHGEPSS
jgi:hypothetical protein